VNSLFHSGFLRRQVQYFQNIIKLLWKNRLTWIGKAFGALFVFVAGWYGLLIGLLVGYLTDELLKQYFADKAIALYFENPTPNAFPEHESGSASFCALAVALLSASVNTRTKRKKIFGSGETFGIVENAAGIAAQAFGSSSDSSLETYARIAASRIDRMNIDLLAESLASRRAGKADAPRLALALEPCAEGPEAKRLYERMRRVLDPNCQGGILQTGASSDPDSWTLLGLKKDADLEEVKTAFRRLAVQFHPDAQKGLDEKRGKAASEAFMKIDAAYRDILKHRGS